MSAFTFADDTDSGKMFLVNLSDLEGRLDPIFYNPTYQQAITKLKRSRYAQLGSLVSFSSESWNQRSHFSDTFPYIEISEIDTITGDITSVSLVPKEEAPSRAKRIVRTQDIIVSTTRPGRGAIALIREEHDFNIASTGFAVLRNCLKMVN